MRKPLFVFPPTPGCAFHPARDAAASAPRRMQPVSRNPFAPGGHFWRQITPRPVSGSLRQRTGPFRLPPATPAAHARHLRHIGHPAQTGHSASRKLNTPPAVGRPCSARQATLYAGAGTKKPGRQPTLYAEAGTKKTGRQPTLGPARGTGYRDASSCRRPAICRKISAQITRRTGTARQPGQPVVQI